MRLNCSACRATLTLCESSPTPLCGVIYSRRSAELIMSTEDSLPLMHELRGFMLTTGFSYIGLCVAVLAPKGSDYEALQKMHYA